ncbi:MAG: patatin-like phospholipase family protein, partial [Trichodesmium sp. St16_bin4-tuft]|nr:patatin-like phospholipase family protein [Trichodesmium sp. St5_bin8]MDE5092012.1 patatin-like phospholipase family protein [Trichodesmium sp. St18_bin3_1_1]MDE5100347.1 patatin-like phospholipase family protein [Trichodesmium sp. St16_bin4-tuft]MDE5105351.1 patatin-like phospholipase family protein [Trichodesmium sp. St19_bin2]
MAFRILCLDGGGIRGIMPARILQKVEEQLGGPLKDHFDLIAGTSTGSILAVGIGLGKSPEDMLNLYMEKGLQIFPYQSLFSLKRLPIIFKYGLSAPKFSHEGLMGVLQEQFGEKKFSDITPDPNKLMDSLKILVPSYDTIGRNPVIFKSWHHDRWYSKVPLWEICLSSASAPTYFPAHRIKHDGRVYSLIDGGVCANNPVACAVAEAIKLLRQYSDQSTGDFIEQIKVISIGTGDPASPIPWEKVRGWGLVQWGLRIADVFMDAPPDIHRYV